MPVLGILGEQRGDEGKGRFVDMYMPEFDIGARFNGGANAGHTVVVDDEVFKLHGLPTSVVHPGKKSVMGNGVVIDPVRLVAEIDTLADQGVTITPNDLLISSSAHLILPSHISQDEIKEAGTARQGSTKSGIAQAYSAKYEREGVRAEAIKNTFDQLGEFVMAELLSQNALRSLCDLEPIDEKEKTQEFLNCAKRLGEYITDATLFLNRELRKEKPARVLAEGAQAFLLDIDHGMYPYTTSSSATAGGIATGLGIPPKFITKTIGVVKATQSHVGDGPFVTEEIDPDKLARLHGDKTAIDAERGTTTKRTRRLGYLDLPQIKRAQMINGTDEMALTKLDWINPDRYGDEVPICVSYQIGHKEYPIAKHAAPQLKKCTPNYQYLPVWKENIRNVRRFEDLPSDAQSYIHFIEDQTGVPITLIGVGPGRNQVIKR